MPGRVPRDVIRQRCERLSELGEKTALAFHCSFIGSTANVLVESFDERKNELEGHAERYFTVRFPAPSNATKSSDCLGEILPVRITSAEKDYVFGRCLA
jgi:tRNA A37 methylthiotransferase MiaB